MLQKDQTALVLIDVQGKLAHAMHEKEALFENLTKLLRGMCVLDIPMIVTEQYPQGLGSTLPEIASLLPPDVQPLSKVHFSCCGDQGFQQALNSLNRKQILVAGIESHVCVYQTTSDLLQEGYEVEVIADAVSSRTASNREIGLAKMQSRGAALSSVEMVLFELMQLAGGETFKHIQKIVK